MSPALARPLLHTAHLVTFLALLATGLLLFVPSLRAAVTGGYSQVIRDTHRWGGVAFAALPLLLLARFGIRASLAPTGERGVRTLWQGLHIALTVLLGTLFTVTGMVIWWQRHMPESITDPARSLHDWLTYAAVVLVGLHLLEVGAAAIGARLVAAGQAAERSHTS
jgi:cytochrome b subunit of formate dehydrogenase